MLILGNTVFDSQVRYDVKRGFFVQGLLEVEIRGLLDIMAVVDEGNGNRKVSSHLLNKDSSRSHSLLTVYLESDKKDPEDGHLVKQFGKVWRWRSVVAPHDRKARTTDVVVGEYNSLQFFSLA